MLLYRDEHLVVLDKPSGMLVHRGWGRSGKVALFEARDLVGRHVYPVHRLDRGTSGVLVFALDPDTARALHQAFAEGRVRKRYLALVRGVAPNSVVVEHALDGRPATTEIHSISSSPVERVSLVEAIPRTGRLHQIRRHLKHLSHPVIGDANYGKGALNRELAARYGLSRLALHAAALAFEHPATGVRVEVRAPLPADLAEPLAELGIAL